MVTPPAADPLTAILGSGTQPGLFPRWYDAMGTAPGTVHPIRSQPMTPWSSTCADLSDPNSPLGSAIRKELMRKYGQQAIESAAGNNWHVWRSTSPEEKLRSRFFQGQTTPPGEPRSATHAGHLELLLTGSGQQVQDPEQDHQGIEEKVIWIPLPAELRGFQVAPVLGSTATRNVRQNGQRIEFGQPLDPRRSRRTDGRRFPCP